MPDPEVTRRRIRVTGTVQGVGFRPFVFREATRLGLGGWVRNDPAGVLIEVEGAAPAIGEVARLLVDHPPPLARVTSVTSHDIPVEGSTGFTIIESVGRGAATSPVSVDTATCDACLAEMADPDDRRHRYPFTNCTNCGPRYTIVTSIPYDRPGTTMAGFPMCACCRAEYDDPTDRRFHAQPIACAACGPTLRWTGSGTPDDGSITTGEAALAAAIDTLRSGGIVAVKGIGGFHLAVDATDDAAVAELRRRKHRDHKPFAVMVADLAAARELCDLDEEAAGALTSAGRPIVLAPRWASATVAAGVAPGLPDLGVLLGYSPLHHLLLAGVGRPLVMTSGNLSDEPIAHEDDDATARLGVLVDGLLGHDRGIHIRCDDSVVHARSGARPQMLRRSRGFAPEPLPLSIRARSPILAVGAELKSTVAVTLGAEVVASHHLGDLEHLATYRSFVQAIDHLLALYEVRPEVIAHDLHPEYLSSKWADDTDLPTVGVQHHHAHIASCLTEHCRTDPVLGLAFDGIGHGTDGTLWGGEFLVADLRGFERVGHLAPITMPGGVTAIREPWRMGVAWATRAGRPDPFDHPLHGAVLDLATRGHGPVTTSMGRLFDAVAALLGGRRVVSYEAQGAIEMEALARSVPWSEAPSLPVEIGLDDAGMLVLDPAPLVAALLDASAAGVAAPLLAASFHQAIGRAAASAAVDLARRHGLSTVVLTGGVFQNPLLSAIVEESLAAAGLAVLVHHRVPPNDGGISIGQAAVVAARMTTVAT